jgi:hypothetical protein
MGWRNLDGFRCHRELRNKLENPSRDGASRGSTHILLPGSDHPLGFIAQVSRPQLWQNLCVPSFRESFLTSSLFLMANLGASPLSPMAPGFLITMVSSPPIFPQD